MCGDCIFISVCNVNRLQYNFMIFEFYDIFSIRSNFLANFSLVNNKKVPWLSYFFTIKQENNVFFSHHFVIFILIWVNLTKLNALSTPIRV